MHPIRSQLTRPHVVVAALAIATLLTACSETATPTPVPPPAAAPAPPPARIADALPAPIPAGVAANRLGAGFAIAFTNLPTDPLVDNPEINDIAPIRVDALPLNITDPN